MKLRRLPAALSTCLAASPVFAIGGRSAGAEGASRPDWVIAVALVVLLAIFGVISLAYLGAFRRKDRRGYGWWW